MVMLLDYFKLREFDNSELVQTKRFYKLGLNERETLETIGSMISNIDINDNDPSRNNALLSSYISEILAVNYVQNLMEKLNYSDIGCSQNGIFCGRMAGSGYNGERVIGNSDKFVAKKIHSTRYVILGKNGGHSPDDYNLKSEFDGMYMIYQGNRNGGKIEDIIIIETKLGGIKLDPEHVTKNVIIPIREIYNDPGIIYMIVGTNGTIFKKIRNKNDEFEEPDEYSFQHVLRNGVRDKVKGIQEKVNNLGLENVIATAMAFPFEDAEFSRLVGDVAQRRNGNIRGNFSYNRITGEIEFVDFAGTRIIVSLIESSPNDLANLLERKLHIQV